MTETELKLIAATAIIGESLHPLRGCFDIVYGRKDCFMSIHIINLDIDLSLPSHEGKFVQFKRQEEEYLVFSRSLTYHVAILGEVLTKWNIPFHYDGDSGIKDLECDPPIEIVGGGRFKINGLEETLILYGKSDAFGLFKETGLIEQIGKSDHPFARLIVTVRPPSEAG